MADNWIKHAIIGGIGAVTIGRLAEKYANDEDGLDDDQKRALVGATIGVVGGGASAYLISDRVIDNNTPEGSKKKLLVTLLGAAGGGAAGYRLAKETRYDSRKALPEEDKGKQTKEKNE